jgi:hypothetical protein
MIAGPSSLFAGMTRAYHSSLGADHARDSGKLSTDGRNFQGNFPSLAIPLSPGSALKMDVGLNGS